MIALIGPELQEHEEPVVVLIAFQNFRWLVGFGLLNVEFVGMLLAYTYGLRKRRVVLLTNQRLILRSAPLFRAEQGETRESFTRDALSVVKYDPRMMETPELHLRIGDRVLRLETLDRLWAPELVELHRQLAPGTASTT